MRVSGSSTKRSSGWITDALEIHPFRRWHMGNRSGTEWLFLMLGSELSLALAPPPRTGRFRVGDAEYRAPDDNYLTAFYDRLVDSDDRLVGIRIHPATEPAEELIQRVRPARYLLVGPGYIDIFLSGPAVPDAESTSDQAFGGQVFLSDRGDIAISVDVHHLCASPEDIDAIRGARATRVALDTGRRNENAQS